MPDPGAPAPAREQPPAWQVFADAALHRGAVLHRVSDGVQPRDLAGTYVDDADVEAVLRTLPGLRAGDPEREAGLRALLDPALDRAREDLHAWAATGTDALAVLARRAALEPADVEVLALALAVEVHPDRQRLVAYLQDNVLLPRPTVPLLDRLLGAPAVAAARPGARLRRLALLGLDAGPAWGQRMLAVPEVLCWAAAAAGRAAVDPDLPPGCRLEPPLSGGGPAEGVPRHLRVLHGGDRQSRRELAAQARPGAPLLVAALPSGEDAARAWDALTRHGLLAGASVLLETVQGPDALARERLESRPEVAWALSSPRELPVESLPRRPWQETAVTDPRAADPDWRARLAIPAPEGLTVTREQLRLVAAAAGGDPARVPEGVRRLAGGHLDSLAVRIGPRRTWADLVLPAELEQQVRELAVRHRHRHTVHGAWGFGAVPSCGVIGMFAGPSGTGKTLAAEVVAGDLGLDLYKIDLSSVVSKYIGETEKNLDRIFDAAGAGDLVLFFDEADALFGKRSEVSDAHDRYANIEVAYLLQRLETYDGLVVMATNLMRNIDQAFLRRISVAVEFASPEQPQRRRIWERAFPPSAPVEGLDLDFLAARFKVTGGVIRNVALGAAFLAAQDGEPITMERVMLAMMREYQKLGRLRSEADFGPYLGLVTGRGTRDGVDGRGRDGVDLTAGDGRTANGRARR
ncbi:MAG: ATP-binding protein [Kineosporiaceae bacterium]